LESDEHDQESYLKRLWSLLRGEKTETDTEKEIEKLLDEVEEKGFIDEEQGDMIHNIVVLKETLAREIMVPKGDMVALEASSSIDDLVELITKEGCSRIPIYEENLDNIIGVVYAKDILKYWKCQDSPCDIRTLMQPPYFVPEGKKIIDLLKEFRMNRPKIAIVIDEYGTVDGLLTIGDIVEEIVGDMVEEGDQTDEEEIVQKAAGVYVVDPKLSVDEFADEFETEIPEGNYDTVGGFITYKLERIPEPGESLEYDGIRFEIAETDKKRITKLIVHTQPRKEA